MATQGERSKQRVLDMHALPPQQLLEEHAYVSTLHETLAQLLAKLGTGMVVNLRNPLQAREALKANVWLAQLKTRASQLLEQGSILHGEIQQAVATVAIPLAVDYEQELVEVQDLNDSLTPQERAQLAPDVVASMVKMIDEVRTRPQKQPGLQIALDALAAKRQEEALAEVAEEDSLIDSKDKSTGSRRSRTGVVATPQHEGSLNSKKNYQKRMDFVKRLVADIADGTDTISMGEFSKIVLDTAKTGTKEGIPQGNNKADRTILEWRKAVALMIQNNGYIDSVIGRIEVGRANSESEQAFFQQVQQLTGEADIIKALDILKKEILPDWVEKQEKKRAADTTVSVEDELAAELAAEEADMTALVQQADELVARYTQLQTGFVEGSIITQSGFDGVVKSNNNRPPQPILQPIPPADTQRQLTQLERCMPNVNTEVKKTFDEVMTVLKRSLESTITLNELMRIFTAEENRRLGISAGINQNKIINDSKSGIFGKISSNRNIYDFTTALSLDKVVAYVFYLQNRGIYTITTKMIDQLHDLTYKELQERVKAAKKTN